MKREKIVYIALIIAALASTCYLLMLGYFALPSADDFGWTRQVSEINPFGFVKKFYFEWQGRYSGLFVDGILCQCFGWKEHLLGFTILELLLGYGAIYLLLRDLLKISDKGILVPATMLITNLGVMAFPEIGTFYWLCTSNYIHEIWFSIYLAWFIFYCKRTWLQWIGMFLCSVYLGGCSENYSPVVVIVLGILLLYGMFGNKEWRIWKSNQQMMVFVSAVLVFVGFMVMYLAPGNAVRLEEEQPADALMNHFSLSIFIVKVSKATFVILLRLLSKGWYYLCAMPLFIIIGAKSPKSFPKLTWQRSIISLCITFSVIMVSVAGMVYGLGWYATMRANCFMTFVVMAWVGYIGLLIGGQLKETKQMVSILAILSSLAITATAIVYTAQEYPIVRKYNQDVVAIHHLMQQYVAEGRTETVYIHPVDIPYRQSSYGYLRNALQVVFHKSKRYQEYYFPYEPFIMTANPTNWRNITYQYWLNAKFDIICIDEEMD